jgi:hypothetical protein
MVFTGGSGPTTHVDGGPVAMAARRVREASATERREATPVRLGEGSHALHLAGPAVEHRDSEATTRHAWQG